MWCSVTLHSALWVHPCFFSFCEENVFRSIYLYLSLYFVLLLAVEFFFWKVLYLIHMQVFERKNKSVGFWNMSTVMCSVFMIQAPADTFITFLTVTSLLDVMTSANCQAYFSVKEMLSAYLRPLTCFVFVFLFRRSDCRTQGQAWFNYHYCCSCKLSYCWRLCCSIFQQKMEIINTRQLLWTSTWNVKELIWNVWDDVWSIVI